ncbi:ABC transporter permease [Flagellimonas lutimaris]|uniref:ABC transporter permease n=1 Tax=Flagellimonas lutimaris TaxID=475082 RepID=UPI003F5CE64F
MRDYFELQLVMTNRKIKEAGVNPALGYFLGLIAFVLLSEYIFHKTEFAKYLVILACLGFQLRLSEKSRTDFLLATFGDKSKMKIRVLENLIISFPFALILVYKSSFLEAIILLLCSITIALFSFHSNLNFTIPTPFSKNPFEFTTGFRKTFLIFPLTYALSVIAINVGNFNLGIFSMSLMFLITLSYYSKPEEEFYVWVHANTPKSFLMKKMMIATKNSTLLTIPISLGLLIFYPAEYNLILLFLFIGILFLWTMVLAKYSAFPSEINLPEGIIIAFALSFPPLILLIIPYFYTKSIKNLRLILND